MATKIDSVLEDLRNCKKIGRNELYADCVDKRLTKSLELYEKENKERQLYLRYKSEYSVLRKYRRLLKDEV